MKKAINIERLKTRLKSEYCRSIMRITSEIGFASGKFLREKGFGEINPVIISPVTDPLRYQVFDGTIKAWLLKYLKRR